MSSKFVAEVESGALFVTLKANDGSNRLIISIDLQDGRVLDVAPCAPDIKLNELARLINKAKEALKAEQIKQEL